MPEQHQMRAADADRERIAERLRSAVDEGRLDLDELDERLRKAYAAKTFGDLDRVIADLPGPAPVERSQLVPGPAAGPVPPSRHEENARLPRWIAFLWKLWFVVVLINLVIWFAVSVTTAEVAYFWPIWVAGPWGAANLALTILFPPRRS